MLLIFIWVVNFGGNHFVDAISRLWQIRPGLLSFLYFIIHTFFPISHQPSHNFYLKKIFIMYVDFPKKVYLCHMRTRVSAHSTCGLLCMCFLTFFFLTRSLLKKHLSMTKADRREGWYFSVVRFHLNVNFHHDKSTVGELCLPLVIHRKGNYPNKDMPENRIIRSCILEACSSIKLVGHFRFRSPSAGILSEPVIRAFIHSFNKHLMRAFQVLEKN